MLKPSQLKKSKPEAPGNPSIEEKEETPMLWEKNTRKKSQHHTPKPAIRKKKGGEGKDIVKEGGGKWKCSGLGGNLCCYLTP